jgi:hypothetical protein
MQPKVGIIHRDGPHPSAAVFIFYVYPTWWTVLNLLCNCVVLSTWEFPKNPVGKPPMQISCHLPRTCIHPSIYHNVLKTSIQNKPQFSNYNWLVMHATTAMNIPHSLTQNICKALCISPFGGN